MGKNSFYPPTIFLLVAGKKISIIKYNVIASMIRPPKKLPDHDSFVRSHAARLLGLGAIRVRSCHARDELDKSHGT